MRQDFQPGFLEQLDNFPPEIQRKFQKQLVFLLQNIRHPSLRSKKFDESGDIWQARVDKNVRFYFKIQNDTITLLSIIKHPD